MKLNDSFRQNDSISLRRVKMFYICQVAHPCPHLPLSQRLNSCPDRPQRDGNVCESNKQIARYVTNASLLLLFELFFPCNLHPFMITFHFCVLNHLWQSPAGLLSLPVRWVLWDCLLLRRPRPEVPKPPCHPSSGQAASQGPWRRVAASSSVLYSPASWPSGL